MATTRDGETGRVGVTAADLPLLDSVFPICPPLALRVRESGDGDGDDVPVATFDDSAARAAAAQGGEATRGLLVTASQAALLRRAATCAASLLRSLYGGAPGGRPQIVHGDLHMANVMQGEGGGGDGGDGDGARGPSRRTVHPPQHTTGRLHLIDFDGCAWGFPAQDLAVLLWALRFEGLEEILRGEVSPRFPALRAAVLRGYSAMAPLPGECGSAVGGDIVRPRAAEAAAAGEGQGSWPALPLLDALVAHRDLVVLAWFAATDVAFLRPRVAGLADATLARMRDWVPPAV